MKLLPILFLSLLTLSSSYAATCVCAPSDQEFFDEIEYNKCVREIVPSKTETDRDSPRINCDSDNLSDAELALCMANDALEDAIEANYSVCSTLAKKPLVELLFLAEGQKITLEKFGSKEACTKSLKKTFECRK